MSADSCGAPQTRGLPHSLVTGRYETNTFLGQTLSRTAFRLALQSRNSRRLRCSADSTSPGVFTSTSIIPGALPGKKQRVPISPKNPFHRIQRRWSGAPTIGREYALPLLRLWLRWSALSLHEIHFRREAEVARYRKADTRTRYPPIGHHGGELLDDSPSRTRWLSHYLPNNLPSCGVTKSSAILTQ